jgi:hypothetical protein
MSVDAPRPAQAAIRTELGAIFVSMELSRRACLITSLSPGAGRRCPSTRFRRATYLGCCAGLPSSGARLRRGPAGTSRLSSSGRPSGRLLDPPDATGRRDRERRGRPRVDPGRSIATLILSVRLIFCVIASPFHLRKPVVSNINSRSGLKAALDYGERAALDP